MMTPEQSLALITDVIQEARERHEESGAVYMYWGLIVALAAGVQFGLIQSGQANLSFVPWLLMPVAAIASYFLFHRHQAERNTNLVGILIRNLWLTIGINLMVLGFFLWEPLGIGLVPVILILLGISLSLSGAALRYKPLFWAGIGTNVAGVMGFWLPYEYQPLLLMGVNLLAVALPGAMMYRAHQRRKGGRVESGK